MFKDLVHGGSKFQSQVVQLQSLYHSALLWFRFCTDDMQTLKLSEIKQNRVEREEVRGLSPGKLTSLEIRKMRKNQQRDWKEAMSERAKPWERSVPLTKQGKCFQKEGVIYVKAAGRSSEVALEDEHWLWQPMSLMISVRTVVMKL